MHAAKLPIIGQRPVQRAAAGWDDWIRGSMPPRFYPVNDVHQHMADPAVGPFCLWRFRLGEWLVLSGFDSSFMLMGLKGFTSFKSACCEAGHNMAQPT